jgi:hypothetical protein
VPGFCGRVRAHNHDCPGCRERLAVRSDGRQRAGEILGVNNPLDAVLSGRERGPFSGWRGVLRIGVRALFAVEILGLIAFGAVSP